MLMPRGTVGRRQRGMSLVELMVGIAVGLFITAVHRMGLVSLTHTPNPMGFLAELLGRPANERAYLIMPVGYPAADARVPDIHRKPLDAIADFR